MPAYDTRGRARPVIDPLLSNISVGWSVGNQMVADLLAPPVRTTKQSGEYFVFGREAFEVNHGGDVRAPASQANEIPGMRVATDVFNTIEHALQQTVTPEERELYAGTPLRPDQDATENVTSKIVLGRELSMATAFRDSTNYTPGHVEVLAGTEQFNDHTNSDPIGVFRRAFRRFHRTLFTVPNTAIIPFEVMSALEDHPAITERYVAQGGVMTAEMIASILGVQRVIVPGGGYNSAGNPGRPQDISYIWGNDIILAWVPPRAGWKIPAFAYEFLWPINGRTMPTDRWYDNDRIADVIRVRRRYDHKFIAVDDDDKSIAGYLIKDAVLEGWDEE